MKERIKQLLINGFKPSEIVDIVGCSPSYISQLLHDEDFKKEVEAQKVIAQAEKTEEDHLDVKYQGLEHDLIKAARQALPEASLAEISRALETIHKREQLRFARKHPISPSPAVNVHIVSLALPAHALESHVPTVEMNEKQEIIAINGRALAPMSSDGVKNIFASRMPVQAPMLPPSIIEEI